MITQEELKKILHYNPDTGIFTNLVDRGRARKGDIAGTLVKGYVRIYINKKGYNSHSLAWLYMTGEWPQEYIDHINCIKNDNRWCNLREATNSQNQFNQPKYKNNKSGYKGVSFHKETGKWRARIRKNNKYISLGLYPTPEQASEAYNKKAEELQGEFLHEIT